MSKIKKGDKVMIVNCAEADIYGHIVFEAISDSWFLRSSPMFMGVEVIRITSDEKDIPGGFSVDCLVKVDDSAIANDKKLLDKAHSRVRKMLRSGKHFIVVAIDEPYYEAVYRLIRANEKIVGRWTKDDEEVFMRKIRANRKLMKELGKG